MTPLLQRYRFPVLLLGVLALLASTLLLGGSARAGASSTNATGRAATGPLGVEAPASNVFQSSFDFSGPFDTHTFTIKVAAHGNRVTADTLDCCIAGDHWGVFLMRYGGTPTGVSNPNAANCGTGSTSAFSGAATLSGTYLAGKVVQVIVTHCSGVSAFPAGLTVRFTSNVNIAVTQQS